MATEAEVQKIAEKLIDFYGSDAHPVTILSDVTQINALTPLPYERLMNMPVEEFAIRMALCAWASVLAGILEDPTIN